MTTRELFNALADRLVGEGWAQDGDDYVECDDAFVHLSDRNGEMRIEMHFDDFIPAHLDGPLETVDDYIREINIEKERWEAREK